MNKTMSPPHYHPNHQPQAESAPALNTPLTTPAPHSQRDPSPPRSVLSPTTHGDIAQRAYDLYVQSGYQPGHCTQNWQQAEKDLREQGPVACNAEHTKNTLFAPDSVGAR